MALNQPPPRARPTWTATVFVIGLMSLAIAAYFIPSLSGSAIDDADTARPLVQIPDLGPSSTQALPSTLPLGATAPIPGARLPDDDVRHALALPTSAITRNVTSYSRELGVLCGDVSLGGDAAGFKRFLFIRTMKTGRIDDGTQDFRTHAANVCVHRN